MNPALLLARYYLKTYWFFIACSAFFMGNVFVFGGYVPESIGAFFRRTLPVFITGAIPGGLGAMGIAWSYDCFLYGTFRKVLPSFIIIAFVWLFIGLNEIYDTFSELYNYTVLVVLCGGMLTALTLLAFRTYKVVWQLFVYFVCLFFWFVTLAGYFSMMKDYFFPH